MAPQVARTGRIAGFGCFAMPSGSLVVVLFYSLAVVLNHAEIDHAVGVAAIRCSTEER